jgi:hypothetical protein
VPPHELSPLPLCQAVTGGSDSVCLRLGGEAGGVGVFIANPLPAQSHDAGDGHALASANGMRGTASGQVRITNGTHGGTSTVLGVAGQSLALTGTTAAEAGNGEIHQVGCGVLSYCRR